jgi:hypothetical protein
MELNSLEETQDTPIVTLESPIEETPVVTLEDSLQVTPTSGEYPIAKAIVSGATSKPVTEGPVEFNSFVDNAWRSKVKDNNAADYDAAQLAASKNNLSVAELAFNEIRTRTGISSNYGEQLYNQTYNEVAYKLKELSRNAVEDSIIKNPAALFNNSAAELSANTEIASSRMAALATIQRSIEDGGNFWNVAKGFAHALLPTSAYEGQQMQNIAVKYGVVENNVGYTTGRNEVKTRLRNVFESLDEDKKGEWLTGLYKDLTAAGFISNWQAALMLQDVVSDEELTWDGFSDWADRVGVAATFLSALGAVGKSFKIFGNASKLNNSERILSASGMKSKLVQAEQVKILQRMAFNERVRGTGVLLGEATGIGPLLDLTKLVSMSAAKVLPDSIVAAASDLQQTIRTPVEKLIAELQDTISAKGVKSTEAAAQLEELRQVYSPARNRNIHSVDPFTLSADGTTITGKVYYKPADGSAYLTKEAAETALKALDPDGKLGMKLVPDTTNTGFYVEESKVVDLKARIVEKEAELLKALDEIAAGEKAPTKGAKTPLEGAKVVGELPTPPKQLLDSKPRWSGGVPLVFTNNIDKAAYQVGSKTSPSKSDLIVKEWLQRTTGWGDEQIKAHASSVRASVSTLASVPRTEDVLSIPAVYKQNEAKASAVVTVEETFEELKKIDGAITVGNVTMKSKHSKPISEFITTLGRALGMDKHNIVILDYEDMLTSTNSVIKRYAETLKTDHLGASGVHFTVGNITKGQSLIVLRNTDRVTKKPITLQNYLSTFAHEYAHAFENAFTAKHFSTINDAFNSWLTGKKITFTGQGSNLKLTDKFPIEALLEYRSIMNVESELPLWINKWMDGDKSGYLSFESQIHKWASSYSEFFAENFAKWAFSNDVPTTILGQYFAKLVNSFKLVVEQIQLVLSKANISADVGYVDLNISKMLNDHIKELKETSVPSKASFTAVAEDLPPSKTRLESILKDIDALQEEQAAMEDATRGIKTGWLIERPVAQGLGYAEVGKYTGEDINSAVRWAFGDRALEGSAEMYADRVVGVNQQSRYTKLLTNFVRPSVESLNRAELGQLSDILVLGDKENKIFLPHELAGAGLSPKARDAYYRVRALRDVMWQMRNDVAAKSLKQSGYVEILSALKLDEGGGSSVFAKPITPKEGSNVFIVDDGSASRMGTSLSEEAAKRGLKFFELNEPVVINGKRYKTLAYTDLNYTQRNIETVIPYREGEYRRIYTDEYFVKGIADVDVDGTIASVTETLRTAKSVKDADNYVAAFNKAVALHKSGKLTLEEASKIMQPYGWNPEELMAALNTGKYDNMKLEVRYNRTDDDYVRETIGMSSNYATKRGDKVLSVFGEDTVNTLNPLDSIASEIGNTAFVASITEWRESHIMKWYNTFIDEIRPFVGDVSPKEAFMTMYNNKGYYIGRSKNLQVAAKAQEYIIAQLNIPTNEEKNFIGFMRGLSESIEGKFDNKAATLTGMALRATKDYPQWARTIAFNSFFAFNPIQFLMQGMNAFNAVAISPIHGLKAAKASALYALALTSDQETIWRQAARVNNLTSLGLGLKEDEFVEVIRAVRRTGLMDSINSASMYGAETGGFGIFNGMRRKTAGLAATPFNAGEGYSRLVSFDIARREYMVTNPGGAWWTDDALSKVLERQDDLTQNMTRANVATWQQGWKSIPAQFAQYPIKMAMNIVQSLMGNKRVFTEKEATRLLIAHTLVMGTAGSFLWPFRDLLTDVVPKDLTEEQRLYIQQGVVAGFIATATEGQAKLAIGSRFNTFAYYEDLIKGLVDPEKKFLEALAGPSGFASLRLLGGVGSGIQLLYGTGLSMESLAGATNEALKGFSAYNNYQVGRLAKQNFNKIMSGKGADMYPVTDWEIYAKQLGLDPAIKEDVEILYSSRKSHTKQLQADAKIVAYHAKLGMLALNAGDTKSAEMHQNMVTFVIQGQRTYQDAEAVRKFAYTRPEFDQYTKLLTEQAMKDWQVKDLLVKGNN